MTKLEDFITPVDAPQSKSVDVEHADLDFDLAQKPVDKELRKRLFKVLKRSPKANAIWNNEIPLPSRSERDFMLARELKWENFTLQEVANVLCNFKHGKHTDQTAREVIRTFERAENPFTGFDAAYLEEIEAQTNPLTQARDEFTDMINAEFNFLGDADEKDSGVPLFKKLLNQETLAVLYGPSGSGKSFLTLDMAVKLAKGDDFAGFKCKQQMGVFYVCAESGSSFGKRAKAARIKNKIKEKALPQDIPFHYEDTNLNLRTEDKHVEFIIRRVKRFEEVTGHKCGLVVIDTLSAAFGGGNENTEDMTNFVNNMIKIKSACKVTVLIVHHTGKDESAGARGHSSLKCNIDTEIRVKNETRGHKIKRVFQPTKQKDDILSGPTQFGIWITELSKDEDGDPIDTCYVVYEDDTEFTDLCPSIEDEYDDGVRAYLKAVEIYTKYISNPDTHTHKIRHAEHHFKALLHHDMNKSVGNLTIKDENKPERVSGFDTTFDQEMMSMMDKPSPTIIKAYERSRDKYKKLMEEMESDG